MKNNQSIIALFFLLVFSFFSCKQGNGDYDASGSFEAVERIISAEATGTIESFSIEEGQVLKPNDTIGRVDVSNLVLQSEQVLAAINAISSKTNEAGPQVNILKAQLITQNKQVSSVKQQILVLEKEILRFENLVKSDAAPQKNLDDLIGQRSIINTQLAAAKSQAEVVQAQVKSAYQSINIQNRSVLSEIEPNQKRLELIEKQIQDAIIVNDYAGTVITKYAYDGEFTSIGKPLYKIADLTQIILRAYISGDQLSKVKLNDSVVVLTDDGNGGSNRSDAVIEWISSKAEFTPKTIQTKNERANLVYAIKLKLSNDGRFKIGMYGEVKFVNND